MADDYRFDEVINPMWEQMRRQNPEMIVLNGDLVYVDSFEFVERQKATELDIWFRFIDALNRLPVYRWQDIKPILATWDDHDFGTNDADRTFKSKIAARRIFLAFFGGKNLKGTYELENESVYFKFNGFNQKMLFLDNRYFRQPNKDQKTAEIYAHWGEKQHHWLMNNLKDTTPTWVFNGNQFFSGNDLKFKESLQTNNPEHFKVFLEDLKKTNSAVLFASGDIHFSEIMQIPADRTGYPTYEVTSSSMHSYSGEGWENPLRLDGAFTKEFNFLIINSKSENAAFKIGVESWGLADKPYFKKEIEVKK
jgi:phosphodiesterase/alkaline phosphatase D-like protein